MLDRKALDEMFDRARALRLAGDAEALADFFHEDATFRLVGFGEPSRGRAAILSALRHLIDEFEFLEYRSVETLVDGNAVAMWYGLKLRYRPSGRIAETDVFDMIKIEDGKISSFIQHADTALIQELIRN